MTACGPHTVNGTTALRTAGRAASAVPAVSPAERPVTVSGCLQMSGTGGYIVTAVNEPTTVGAPAAVRNRIERERIAAARQAYVLNGGQHELSPLVGTEVRIEGRLARQPRIVQALEHNDVALDAGDLAAIDVAAAERVAPACGQGGQQSS
jgi:hypothetical protein